VRVKRRSSGVYCRPHDRKCELCERFFIATAEDQRLMEYRCQDCRNKPVTKEMRKPERGEFNPYPRRTA
jgi:DNA-directed RNA polymerase subunit RPC12/RpoP